MIKSSSRILEILAYFDLFNYPLTEREIRRFLDPTAGEAATDAVLKQLIAEKLVFRLGFFYSLRNDVSLETSRMEANRRARSLLTVASRTSRLLFNFPYVRGIGLSGSLSKDCSDEKGDIDYFIITCAGRLWVARTFMHLFKKITYLTGRQHWYCMNYYVDERALAIGERNIYTAMEIVTLVPMCGVDAISDFRAANDWTSAYFPSRPLEAKDNAHSRERKMKKLIEKVFDDRFGDRLDNYLMKATKRRWMRKEMDGRINMHGNRMGIIAEKHSCRPNPRFLQDKILKRYDERLSELKRNLHREPDQTH